MESAQRTENSCSLRQEYLITKDEFALLKSVLGDDSQALSVSRKNRREWRALQLQAVVWPLDGKIRDWILSQDSDTDRVVHNAYQAWKLHEQRLKDSMGLKGPPDNGLRVPPDNGLRSSKEELLKGLYRVLGTVEARDSGIELQSTGETKLPMELFIERLTGSSNLFQTQQTLKLTRTIQEKKLENGSGLAEILLNCGKFSEAANLVNQVLLESTNLWGIDDVFTLKTMALQAKLHFLMGNDRQAEAECKNALEQMRLALGSYHRHTLEIASTLTDIYIYQGRWSNAETIAVHVFEKERMVLGTRNERTLKAMDNLAEAKRLVGKLQEARDLAKAAVELSQDIFDHDHPATLLRMSRFCLILCDCNEWDYATSQATETVEKLNLLETRGTEVKSSNLSVGLMMKVIGSCLRQLSNRKQLQLRQAESARFANRSSDVLHQALEANKQTFGENHIRTHESQLELALINRETSRPEAIREVLTEIDNIYSNFAQEAHVKASLNPRHPFLLTLQLELSQTYGTLGAFDQAKELAEKALKDWTELFGRFHPRAIQCARLLATIEDTLHGHEHGKAQAILEEILKDGLEAFPPGYQFLAFDVQADLARVLASQESHLEAIALQEEVIAKRKDLSNGCMSRETIRCMHDLAMMYQRNQDFEKATELHNEVQGELPDDDPLCLVSRANLAVMYFAQQKFEDAAQLERDIWERQRIVQGPNHRDTLVCQFNLARTLMELEFPKDEVTQHLEEVVRKFDEAGEQDSIEARRAGEALELWREKASFVSPEPVNIKGVT
ncbi:kinesin light chain 3 [Lasiodiplodia theobromae]|nr:kinesin light chain 3 [Lasiodiplodia theobromae]